MRVVIDTNILVSFAIRPSVHFETLFDHIAAHDVPLISEDTLVELLTVLTRDKFRKYIPQDQSLAYVAWYAGLSELVLVNRQVTACRDPKDDKFLSLAISGKADCIIAGDDDLLSMVEYDSIPIIRAAEFARRHIP